MKILLRKGLFLLILLLLTACGQAPASTPTPTPKPTHSATPTLTQTPQPSDTSTASPTPTAFPTLPAEQARARLLDLLATNSDCRLPCFWGITPGKSTYQEAKAILEPFSSISDWIIRFSPEGGAISPLYTEGDFVLSTSISFSIDSLSDNQTIGSINFTIEETQKIIASNGESIFPAVYDSKTFGERIKPYTLSQILSEQGIPASVLISTDGGKDRGKNIPGFNLLLFYPNQGLFVAYSTNKQLINGIVRGCPANAHVELELYPPGIASSEFLAQTNWESLWPVPTFDNPFWKSVEKATAMSLDQFYETFRNPTDKCIETPAKIWATPGPGGG